MNFNFQNTSARTIYNLINGLVAPRPIALITSLSVNGQLNAAPFSAYNYLCINPPIIGVGIAAKPESEDGIKDTARNIETQKEFVVNVVTEDMAQAMNICGIDFPSRINELEKAGFSTEISTVVHVPRIKEAHAALECRLYEMIHLGQSRIILGEVVAAFVEDQYIDSQGPYVLAEDLHSIGRMNGLDNYVHTRDAFLKIKRLNYKEWIEYSRMPHES
jgi:flavin reductase (DIM6/NTAB) family NADH-FMN oxidoreductase RutF